MSVGPVDLGSAGEFAVFSLSGEFSLSNSQTTVDGDIALGPGGKQNFSDATIHGSFFVDPTADNGKSNNVMFDGETFTVDLGPAAADVRAAAIQAASLAATQTFGDIDDPFSIHSTGALNVIEVGKIKLDGDETLTLWGEAGDAFVINASDLVLTGTAQIKLAGDLTADDVLFNLGNEYVQSGDSQVNGSVLCVSSNGCTKKARNSGGFLNGSLFAEAIDLTSAAQIAGISAAPVPEPGAALLFGIGVLAVRTRSRA